MPSPHEELQRLAQVLDQVRQGQASVAQFADCARGTALLRAALPERFGTVLDDLLNRLEASALFTEESCSFSQSDLLGSLQMWLDKAGQRLAQA